MSVARKEAVIGYDDEQKASNGQEGTLQGVLPFIIGSLN